ncbi:MAG: hypothetical protein IKS08_04225 [Alphaproteobacteria bacterium]|nr:hypothetical protein [Alphaproteobacteria bacterium]
MLTKIDLCSMALLKLGEKPIQSLSEDTAVAKLGRTFIDVVIDELLAMHPWRFACQSYDLNANTDGTFDIPTDVLRIVKVNGQIMQNKIISQNDKTTITAIVRVPPENFPSYFVAVVATRLAMEFCMPITSDQTLFRTLVALYETELQNAKFIDSTTSINPRIENFSLIDVRF